MLLTRAGSTARRTRSMSPHFVDHSTLRVTDTGEFFPRLLQVAVYAGHGPISIRREAS
jgi:hypothetical protein